MSIGGSTANRSINLELGRSATASSNMNESALRTLAGVSSGAISISDFYGKTNATITLNASYNVSHAVSLNFVGVEFKLESDGDILETLSDDGGSTTNDLGDWVSPKTAAPGSYQVRAYSLSGSGGAFTGDTTNSWLNLTSDIYWSLSVSPGDSGSRSFTIDIGLAGTVLDTSTITLSATS